MYKVKYFHERPIAGRTLERNIGFFYYDQVKISVPDFYYYWVNLLLKKVNHKNVAGLFEISLSICKRIEQLYFTYDVVKDIITNAENLGNPGTFFVFCYHFSYFVSLIKSLGDNLAWVLNLFLNLNLEHKDLDLLFRSFKAKIDVTDFGKIYKLEYFGDYEKLKEFRNIIQHKNIIKSMRITMMDTNEHEKAIAVPRDPELLFPNILRTKENADASLAEIFDDPIGMIDKGYFDEAILPLYNYLKDYEEAVLFCQRHLNGIIEMINLVVIQSLGNHVGDIVNYFKKISVCEANLISELKIGDKIYIYGNTTSSFQTIKSMQVDHKNKQVVKSGSVAILLSGRVKRNDKIYLVVLILFQNLYLIIVG